MPNTDTGHGLWTSMVFAGLIRPDRWKNAVATGEVIGTCRECGGYLVPDDIPEADQGAIRWFTARCLACGHELASPGGRIRKRLERGRDGC